MNWIQVLNEEPFNSLKVNNGFFLDLINIMMIICFHWFELFSQVSDVAHWPLVDDISYMYDLKKGLTLQIGILGARSKIWC